MSKASQSSSGDADEFTRTVCDFWNSRAGLGQWAGTRDVIAKQIELAPSPATCATACVFSK